MAFENIGFDKVELTEGFWQRRYLLNAEKSIYAVKDVFESSGRFDAVRFKDNANPHVYYDSDVMKWIEGVAYLLLKDRKKYADLEKFCDELIASVKNHQREDGYFNSYFQKLDPEGIFTRRNDHELYCAGHLFEAAIAYSRSTGKNDLLDVAEKYAAMIKKVFIDERSAAFATPGHEEIELALYRLYEYTGKNVYRDMATYFVKTRGIYNKDVPVSQHCKKNVTQDNAEAKNLSLAEGHAVRALYLYCAMADEARINNDEEMLAACDRLFKDITERKMYITGGVGSSRVNENFTVPYDLPNLTAYNETCAAIGLILFCLRMQKIRLNGKYADIVERVLYNAFLSGTSLSGDEFFYENPLELSRVERNKNINSNPVAAPKLAIPKRVKVFYCSCCPPNINRFVASLGNVIFSRSEEGIYVNQFISSDCAVGNLQIRTNYPTENIVKISSENYSYKKIFVRVPAWCKKYAFSVDGKTQEVTIKDGYAAIDVKEKFAITFTMEILPHFLHCNPCVRENAGKVALQYGPVVYCIEEVDNGPDLFALSVDVKGKITEEYCEKCGLKKFTCDGIRSYAEDGAELYADEFKEKKTKLIFIPYYAFANREESDMLVWINEKK